MEHKDALITTCDYSNTENMEQSKNHDEILDFAGTIEWLGQATVRINYRGHTIYIDPYQLGSRDNADLVLVTHDHSDHLSPADIAKIAGSDTRFVAASACVSKLQHAGYTDIQSMVPGSKVTVFGLDITAVPAYNVVKQMHPRNKHYVGFLIDFDGITMYHTGDTERIPEMKEIRCDIILLPLGQTYTMNNVEEAVETVVDTKASVAIPIHYGLYEGSEKDAQKFGELLSKRNITVLSGK